jgi:hypothetical protein
MPTEKGFGFDAHALASAAKEETDADEDLPARWAKDSDVDYGLGPRCSE